MSSIIFRIRNLILIASAGLTACGGSETPTTPGPNVRLLSLVSYAPGTSWDTTKPAEEQALGPHLEYVGTEFAAKRLVANGLFSTSPRGLYLIEGDNMVADSFIGSDPGLESNVLTHEGTETWALTIDAIASQFSPGEIAFVLRYRPGSSWLVGKPLGEQDIADHLSFIEQQVVADVVVGGGPVDGGASGGMYLIRAADLAAAQAFAASDPGVSAGTFEPTIDGWQLMNAPTR